MLLEDYLMKTFTILIMVSLTSILVGCSNEKFEQCKNKASKTWDASSSTANNPKYWAAIKRCKKLYP